MVGLIPMTCFKWAFFACFVCSSLGLQTLSQSEGNNDTVASRVAMLILPKKRLKGIISHSLGRLDQLKRLDLSCNHIEGILPVEHVNLKQLEVLDLSHNMLTGRVSQVLSGLKMIPSLNVSSNSFSRDLLELGGFPNLAVFNVSNNSFTGILNSQIWSASNGTEILDLSMNHFVGNLELEGLENCSSSLKELHLDVNSLSGHLLDSLYSFSSSLQQLSLSKNYFSGHLGTLVLSSNHFSGPLPNSLADCHQLKILNLARNDFTGQVPESFAKLKSLMFLSLSNNSFVDLYRALSVLQQCKNLTILILPKNFIGEEIRNNVSGFESLIVLGLAGCGLIGHIPVWLSSCNKLQVLDLPRNHLDGSIPPWIGSMDDLFYLDLSDNSLTGEIPKNLTEL
ncbi:hypothetical protein LWI28_001505 [Acer negundo]|uniref:Uncharacterized protein n=1 Tax=Acer negundo TaxID=4023 RepID=A0AAD5NWP8_ACENE|nr:hypothetical protein LWI28_001505 [Acer negundo]